MFERINKLAQLISFREMRNILLGFSVVLGGLCLALLTTVAHRTGNVQLAGIAAAASLGFVLLIVTFVIPPLARSASAEASQIDLPFEITTGGAIFLGLICVIAFAAWNTGNNLLFIILAVQVSAFIVSSALGFIVLKHLDVKIRFPELIFADEPTKIQVAIRNEKRIFPAVSVLAEVRGKNREYSRYRNDYVSLLGEWIGNRMAVAPLIKHPLDYFVFIPQKKTISNTLDITFPHRTRFMIRDFELSTRFPFGLIRHRKRLAAEEAELIVFPAPADSAQQAAFVPLLNGSFPHERKGDGRELFALRGYIQSDDLRHIHWKATARTGVLMVREFSAEDEHRVRIFFDIRVPTDDADKAKNLREKIASEQNTGELSKTDSRFERGVQTVAGLLGSLYRTDAEFSLAFDAQRFEMGRGAVHYAYAMRSLAILDSISQTQNFPTSLFSEMVEESGVSSSCNYVLITAMDDYPSDISTFASIINY
ncbi:MAG: DUF58 domain-containing protein [Pyrinomonadaceae bacterium]